MHDTLRAGDSVAISAPAGRFTFTGAEAKRAALLAGGVGITPLMSILRHLTDQHSNGVVRIEVVHTANRSRGERAGVHRDIRPVA